MSTNDKSTINFMSGYPLNRLSWLRPSSKFCNTVALHPRAQWLLFRSGDPLIEVSTGKPHQLSTNKLENILGKPPYFGQGQLEGESSSLDLESSRFHGPPSCFLGVLEHDNGEELSDGVKGDPYFALDVSKVEKNTLDEIHGDSEYSYTPARAATSKFSPEAGAIFAVARSMLDWNSRNKFCAGCGSPVYSCWAGWKRRCTSLLPWAEPREPKCPTGSGLHNFQHPRVDPVIITAVIDQSGEKILLGNNKKFPGAFYSTLAGFVEPGEVFEDAVKREIYEESGVSVFDVRYHSCQPWPYPGNLMVGFYATADSSLPIRLDLDTELLDAKWFTRAEIVEVLSHPDGTNIRNRDLKKLEEIVTGKNEDPTVTQDTQGVGKSNPELAGPPFRVPPITAIAGILISEWAYGKAKL